MGERVSYGRLSLRAQAALPQGAFYIREFVTFVRCYLMSVLKQDSAYHIYMETFSEKLSFCSKKNETEARRSRDGFYAKRF